MADLTPEQIVDKQIKAAAAKVQDYRDGVQRTTKNPMERAKAKKQKMRNNFLAALEDGKWEEGLDSVSLADWKKLTSEKGGNNYANGVAMAKPKLLEFQRQFTPARRQVRDEVQEMPNDTYEQRKARMNANADGLHSFRFRKRKIGS